MTLALAAACAPAPSTPPPSSSTASKTMKKAGTTELASRLAIEVYLGMWHNMATAARTSNWRSPLLSEFATGEALKTIANGLYTDYQNGLITLGTPKNSPTVSQIEPVDEPHTVWVDDCGDSTRWLKYDADTGAPANDGPGGRRAISAVVTKQAGGEWRVSDFAVQEVGTC